MKTLKISFLASLVLALTACGGGGGSSAKEQVQKAVNDVKQKIEQNNLSSQNGRDDKSNAESKSPKTNKSTTPSYEIHEPSTLPKNSDPIMPTAPSTKTNLDNGILVEQLEFPKGEINNQDIEYGKISGYNRNYSFNGAWLEPEKDPTILEVAGTKLAMMTQSEISALGGLYGYALSKAFGAAFNWGMSQIKDPERQMFYFGSETPIENIPTQGKITYQGNATRYDNITQSLKNIGTSTLVADFDNKKISGHLDIENDLLKLAFRRDISLKEADIKGNSFEGKAIAGEGSLLMNREGVYEGKFFGPNAEEVAGKATFGVTEEQKQDLKDLNTSFSAEQVK